MAIPSSPDEQQPWFHDQKHSCITTTSSSATTYEQKKKLLEGESDKRRMEYKKRMEDHQREEVHQADESDGVHLFRKAYMSWFKKEKNEKKTVDNKK